MVSGKKQYDIKFQKEHVEAIAPGLGLFISQQPPLVSFGAVLATFRAQDALAFNQPFRPFLIVLLTSNSQCAQFISLTNSDSVITVSKNLCNSDFFII